VERIRDHQLALSMSYFKQSFDSSHFGVGMPLAPDKCAAGDSSFFWTMVWLTVQGLLQSDWRETESAPTCSAGWSGSCSVALQLSGEWGGAWGLSHVMQRNDGPASRHLKCTAGFSTQRQSWIVTCFFRSVQWIFVILVTCDTIEHIVRCCFKQLSCMSR
jgi:hypothetical protein